MTERTQITQIHVLWMQVQFVVIVVLFLLVVEPAPETIKFAIEFTIVISKN